MKFTRQICEEIFPEPESQVRPDPEPERCIALGLARVGRWDLRATAFKEEVNNLTDSDKLKNLIEQHIPELINLLTKPVSDGLIESAVKPGLKDWQNNRIRTLTDLQSSIEMRAKQWLNTQAHQIIKTVCIKWFNSKIQPDLAQETDPICQTFQIPTSSLRFEDGIDPNVVNPDLSIGDAILADTVAFIVNLVIGGGAIASIITLLLTGHFIWPIALVYGAAFLASGVELTKEGIKEAIQKNVDIPSWSRSILLADSKINSVCEEMSSELESGLKKQLTEKQETFDQLIAKVGQELKKNLHTKAEEATILIQ
jgi:molecular chaperone DnaK (HSP70)